MAEETNCRKTEIPVLPVHDLPSTYEKESEIEIGKGCPREHKLDCVIDEFDL